MGDDIDELQRLESELVAMPEWDRLWAVREFEWSFSIFGKNADELLSFLRESEAPDVSSSLFSLDNRDAVLDFQKELMRKVHNFVAAAITLVDHARVFFRERYKERGLFPEYEKEVQKRFATDKLTRFVQDLRNLLLHQRLPAVTSTLHWSIEGRTSHQQFWSKRDLLEFKRWKPEAKAFLDEAQEKVNIADLVTRYAERVQAFYDWLFEQLKVIHEPDEKAVEAKQGQIREVVKRLAGV